MHRSEEAGPLKHLRNRNKPGIWQLAVGLLGRRSVEIERTNRLSSAFCRGHSLQNPSMCSKGHICRMRVRASPGVLFCEISAA